LLSSYGFENLKKFCIPSGPAERAASAKRSYYTLKRVEISKPGGIWKAREGRQGKTQANAKLSQGNEQKKRRGE